MVDGRIIERRIEKEVDFSVGEGVIDIDLPHYPFYAAIGSGAVVSADKGFFILYADFLRVGGREKEGKMTVFLFGG